MFFGVFFTRRIAMTIITSNFRVHTYTLCVFLSVQLSDTAYHDEVCGGEQRCRQTNQSVHFTDWSHCQHGRSSHFPMRCGCVYCSAQQRWTQCRPDLHNPVRVHPSEAFFSISSVLIDPLNIPVSILVTYDMCSISKQGRDAKLDLSELLITLDKASAKWLFIC